MNHIAKPGIVALVLCSSFLCSDAFAQALKPLKTGQYEVGLDSGIQQICLKNDGTWYGTTFNFSGHWINFPQNISRVVGAIYGNYNVQGLSGNANDAITISRPVHSQELNADWYDWYDDFSYEAYVTGLDFELVNKKCDPPFKGDNTHAATQTGG